jgi:glycosyltransferase involved in cell wall biosynthesis
MAGPAIRAWEIARALAGRHDVVLATTTPVCERAGEGFATEAAGPDGLAEREAWCDVVIVQGYVLEHVPVLKATDKVIAVDLYDPIFLEDLELNRAWPEPDRSNQIKNVVRVFHEQICRGDFFVCASEKQRNMWLGYLAAAGRISPAPYATDPTLRALIDVVAFGLPAHPPVASGAPAMRGAVPGIGSDDDVVLWGGGVYDWLDPVTAIRAVDRVRPSRPNIRLFFMGVKHPNPVAEESRTLRAARAEAEERGLLGTHVFFNEGWVPYERRADYLLEADVGISLHTEHVETAYSFRTRILDCIWTGLPTVATQGDTFAELIVREGLGAVVPGGDVEAVAAALVHLLEDPDRREVCREGAARLAPSFAWSQVLEPLVRFCDRPVRAADRPVPPPPPPTPSRPARVVAAFRRGCLRAVGAAAFRAARRRI